MYKTSKAHQVQKQKKRRFRILIPAHWFALAASLPPAFVPVRG